MLVMVKLVSTCLNSLPYFFFFFLNQKIKQSAQLHLAFDFGPNTYLTQCDFVWGLYNTYITSRLVVGIVKELQHPHFKIIIEASVVTLFSRPTNQNPRKKQGVRIIYQHPLFPKRKIIEKLYRYWKMLIYTRLTWVPVGYLMEMLWIHPLYSLLPHILLAKRQKKNPWLCIAVVAKLAQHPEWRCLVGVMGVWRVWQHPQWKVTV